MFIGKQTISASEPLVAHNANGDAQAVVGTTHAVADARTHSATKPLGMPVGRDVRSFGCE